MTATTGAVGSEPGPIRWTGHPFVDAGIAAMCAAVGLKQPSDFAPEMIVQAVNRLERVLTSDQALGVDTDRNFATGALSFVFPNSELVNPANWRGDSREAKAEYARQKFRSALAEELADVLRCVDVDTSAAGDSVCPICGRSCPADTMRELRKAHMPLALGIVNFHPAFQAGMLACAVCTLALRFLPLATLNAGGQRLWILHCHATGVAAGVARRYGWEHFERAIATRTAIDFHSFGATGRGAATVVYLMFELLERFGSEVQAAYERPYSTVAYLFLNDNRGGYVESLSIPAPLLRVLYRIRVRSRHAYTRFWHELLSIGPTLSGSERRLRQRFVESVAEKLIRGEPILGLCLQDEPMKLIGGWVGQRLYLEGVRKVPGFQLALLERVGQAIVDSQDAKRWVSALRTAQPREVYGVFLDLVRGGLLRYDELYSLLAPGAVETAVELRDILLAVVYEATRCRESGEPFPAHGGETSVPRDEILERVVAIGQTILKGADNLNSCVGALQTARSPAQIRRVYLRAVARGAIRFPDFVWLSPPGDAWKTWEHRDYLLAFLFDALREQGVSVEDSVPEDEPVYQAQLD